MRRAELLETCSLWLLGLGAAGGAVVALLSNGTRAAQPVESNRAMPSVYLSGELPTLKVTHAGDDGKIVQAPTKSL